MGMRLVKDPWGSKEFRKMARFMAGVTGQLVLLFTVVGNREENEC
jgi:hypothetical protein